MLVWLISVSKEEAPVTPFAYMVWLEYQDGYVITSIINVGWNYLSLLKLQRLHRWSLGMDNKFHPKCYLAHEYLSMLGCWSMFVKGSPSGHQINISPNAAIKQYNNLSLMVIFLFIIFIHTPSSCRAQIMCWNPQHNECNWNLTSVDSIQLKCPWLVMVDIWFIVANHVYHVWNSHNWSHDQCMKQSKNTWMHFEGLLYPWLFVISRLCLC